MIKKKLKYNLILVFLIFMQMIAFAQIEESSNANFMVEFDKFEPPTKELIKSFEGSAPMQFLAPDINGEEQYLGSFKGQTVFVYFFNMDCTVCTAQISSLNLLQQELADELKIIAIGDGSKADLKLFSEQQGIEYSVLYNGKLLGEAAYGIELGYPRVFIVDKYGITKHVLPEEAFGDGNETYLKLMNLYKLVNAK